MKIKGILLFLVLFGVTGYFRERFFEHMNIILASVYRGTNEYAIIGKTAPAIMSPFLNWSYPALYYSKYPFTFLWVLVFYALSYFAIRKLAPVKNILKILTISYLLLLILAGISMGIGYLVNGTLKNDEYTFSRWLLGIAQSPIICLILLAAVNLYNKSFQSPSNN
ncbi:MAG: hypothetical protein H0W61_10070 [Bacteroidetes bacterium]|nr:hypothetical protein [Bacteroidota bacterium]